MLERKGRLFKFTAVIGFSLALLLSGCTTLPSSKTSFPVVTGEQNQIEDQRFDARALVEQAVKTTNESDETQSFWYEGYIKNGFQNRSTTSMYEGVVYRPDNAYLVNARIAAQPFIYYRSGDTRYINRSSVWYRSVAEESDLMPLDPFGGFLEWLPFLEEAKKLPDATILSQQTDVIEVRINAKQWIEHSNAKLFDEWRELLADAGLFGDEDGDGDASSIDIADTDTALALALNDALENAIVKMTLWIGKENHVIYQYSTWIILPLPGAGYIDQETYFRFYHYNDPSIPDHIQSPDRIEKWVSEFEERYRTGKLQGEWEH